MSEHERDAAGGQVQDVVRSRPRRNEAVWRLRIRSTLEAERQKHIAEIEAYLSLIQKHKICIRSIDAQLRLLDAKAA